MKKNKQKIVKIKNYKNKKLQKQKIAKTKKL